MFKRFFGLQDIVPPAAPVKMIPLQKPLIVVADDDAGIRFTLRLILEQLEYEVHDFSNPDEAVCFLEKPENACKVTTIISDLMMGGKDGIDLLSFARKSQALWHVRFILLTGADIEVFKDLIAPYHVDKIIQKPYQVEAFQILKYTA